MPDQNVLFADFTPTRKLSIERVRAYCDETGALGDTPSVQTIINMIEAGELRGVRARGRWLIVEDSWKSYLQRIEQQAMAA